MEIDPERNKWGDVRNQPGNRRLLKLEEKRNKDPKQAAASRGS